jgi:hypothetical protein
VGQQKSGLRKVSATLLSATLPRKQKDKHNESTDSKDESSFRMSKRFGFASKLTCIIALAALVALASPVLLAAQDAVQKPLVLIFTATFAPKAGQGPSLQYEFQADSFLRATRVALAWGNEYCPQNALVSLVPKLVAPQETFTATFEPKVGKGPSLQYEFQAGEGRSVQYASQADSFLRAIRVALAWGKEYCPQNVLVSLVPKSQAPQEAVTPIARVNPAGLVAQVQLVFTARFVSRDSGLAIQQEVQTHSFLRAARETLSWSKEHCPEYVLFSLVQNQESVQ